MTQTPPYCVQAGHESKHGMIKSAQRVVTYMSCVEACVSGIKFASSDPKPFLGADEGIKVTSEVLKSTDQECVAAI